MGIKQLFNLIQEKAPLSFREITLEIFSTKYVACDASKILYQFYISTTQSNSSYVGGVNELTDKDGNPTGHLLGFIYKSL